MKYDEKIFVKSLVFNVLNNYERRILLILHKSKNYYYLGVIKSLYSININV